MKLNFRSLNDLFAGRRSTDMRAHVNGRIQRYTEETQRDGREPIPFSRLEQARSDRKAA